MELIMSFYPITAGPFALTSVGNASAGSTAYTGTITGGASNAFAGYTFNITGFSLTNGSNNGTFLCTGSSTTTLTLVNPNGVSETGTGTANGCVISAQTGPVAPESTFAYQGSGGTPPAPNLLVVQDTPKGGSLVARNFVNGFNYANTITSSQEYLQNVIAIESAQQGVAAINAPVSFNGGIAKANVQTFKWS